MRGRSTHRTRRAARSRQPEKASHVRKGKDRLGRLLEEWLAETRIRYTHAGE